MAICFRFSETDLILDILFPLVDHGIPLFGFGNRIIVHMLSPQESPLLSIQVITAFYPRSEVGN